MILQKKRITSIQEKKKVGSLVLPRGPKTLSRKTMKCKLLATEWQSPCCGSRHQDRMPGQGQRASLLLRGRDSARKPQRPGSALTNVVESPQPEAGPPQPRSPHPPVDSATGSPACRSPRQRGAHEEGKGRPGFSECLPSNNSKTSL